MLRASRPDEAPSPVRSRHKYLLAFTVPVTVWIALLGHGVWTFLPLLVYFGLVPALELLLDPVRDNLDGADRSRAEADARWYDALLHAVAPVQVATLLLFLVQVREPGLSALETVGRITAMGACCGILGINAGHELGHRKDRLSRFLGQVAMLTSLENHFAPYHNRGHHRNVATPDDPATARRGETVYRFWLRSHVGSWTSAWRLEAERLATRGVTPGSPAWFAGNAMVVWTAAQVALLAAIGFLAGPVALAGFLGAAAFGIVLLETVNYIEHYGLVRERRANGAWERVGHRHSWNSDHPLGRTLLFELSRHSDHHFRAGKRYELLDSHADSPQMPTGYPAMMLLALVPPLWFRTMHPRIDRLQAPPGRSAAGATA